jgi:carbon starvation protein
MKAIVLPCLFVILTFFGYATVGRWLQRATFRLPPRPPTDEERVSVSSLTTIAAHAATVPGLLTLTSVTIALYWGWTPAFVWILIGTTVSGIVYFLGNRYWSNFISPAAPFIEYEETGSRTIKIGHGLLLSMLILTSAVLMALMARLLSDHPGVAVALALTFPAYICYAKSSLLTGTTSPSELGWALVSLLCLSAGIVIGSTIDSTVGADWRALISNSPWLTLSSHLLWLAAILITVISLGRSQKSSATGSVSEFGIFSGKLFLILILLMGLGLAVSNASINMPSHTPDETIPSFLWLFALIFVGGAMSASRGLVSLERRYLEGGLPRHGLHFAGFTIDALFAVMIVGLIASLDGAAPVLVTFDTWPGTPDISTLVIVGSSALATALGALGLSSSVSITLVIFILLLTSLAFVAQLLSLSGRMLDQSGLVPKLNQGIQGWIAPGIVGLVTTLTVIDGPAYFSWLILGLLNALSVAILMLYANWTLVRNQQTSLATFTICLLVLLAAIPQGLMAIVEGLSDGRWLKTLTAVAILLTTISVVVSLLKLTFPELRQPRSGLDLFDRE